MIAYNQRAKANNLWMKLLLALEDPVREGELIPSDSAYMDERYDQLKSQFSKKFK